MSKRENHTCESSYLTSTIQTRSRLTLRSAGTVTTISTFTTRKNDKAGRGSVDGIGIQTYTIHEIIFTHHRTPVEPTPKTISGQWTTETCAVSS
ncbi:hypothetical protein HSBGL_4125 (plasmid) [Halapricum desulfuricans]|uniref:Uncharacterized protein n=1 Tax=Halapricum desulfuricans TaxID=2841257 RepID=A0A897NRU8_9EURY|nr:hypothetical protein HSBGL_4125 [Halapricum desulfuricans]